MLDKYLHYLYSIHEGKVSDKWSSYLRVYDRLFDKIRERPLRILEIGVQNGGSLEIWAKYFPKAVSIVGCDIDQRVGGLRFEDERIVVVVGDATDASVVERIHGLCPRFDLIIDDGSHRSSDIVRTFLLFFSGLAPGGLYVVEDLACSYWAEYEGGLYAPAAAMQFFKALSDCVNVEAWGVPVEEGAELFNKWNIDRGSLCQMIESIAGLEFYPSMCVIRKSDGSPVCVGERVIAGCEFPVCDDMRGLGGRHLDVPEQKGNPQAHPSAAWEGRLWASGQLMAQLYISGHAGYSESGSARLPFEPDGVRNALTFTLPMSEAPLRGVRLDPANQPAAITLHMLALEAADGTVLWRWDGQPGLLRNVLGLALRPGTDGLLLVCWNDDPQFEIAIPEEVLASLGPGAQLVVEMTPRPLLEVLPELLAEPHQLPAPVTTSTGLPAAPVVQEFVSVAQLMRREIERRNATIGEQRAQIEELQARLNALEAHVVRAEAQLDVLKEFVLTAFGQTNERI